MTEGALDTDALARGREAYAQRRWLQAYESLSRADEVSPLGAEDLELLAIAAFMLATTPSHASSAHTSSTCRGARRSARCTAPSGYA